MRRITALALITLGAALSCSGGTPGAAAEDAGPDASAPQLDATVDPPAPDPPPDDAGAVVDSSEVLPPPGPPAVPCPGDVACDAGSCVPVSLGTTQGPFPPAIAVGGENVYWVSTGTAGVLSGDGAAGYLDRCGGGGKTLVSPQNAPYYIAADALGACWANLGRTINGAYQNDGEIVCYSAAGLNVVAKNEQGPGPIVVDALRAFWSNGEYVGDVRTVHRIGGFTTTLTSLDMTGNYELALDRTTVYVAANTDVVAVPRGGGARTTLTHRTGPLFAIASDGTRVYFNDQGTKEILAMPVDGGTATTLATVSSGLSHLIVNGDSLFYVDGSDVMRIRTDGDGGAPEKLASGVDKYGHFTTDGVYVYYASGPTVWRVRIP